MLAQSSHYFLGLVVSYQIQFQEIAAEVKQLNAIHGFSAGPNGSTARHDLLSAL